jgi:DNA-directed RNA polymerase specialized sigma24 family protein
LAAFRELPDHHLQTLSDEQLIAYTRSARAAGQHAAMRPAIAVLAFGYWDNLVGRARLKLPEGEAEQVAGEALESAIASAFDGSSVGEFRSWLHTILSRRIADYWQKRERSVPTQRLVAEHGDSDEVWGQEPATAFEGDAVFARDCVRVALEELPAEHLRVVRLYLLGPHGAAETARLAGDAMTEANVHQIASRFRRRVAALLAEGGGP